MFPKPLRDLLLCAVTSILVGCSSGTSSLTTTGGAATASPGASTLNPLLGAPSGSPPSPEKSITQPSIYIVDDTTGPNNIQIISKSATGVVYSSGTIPGLLPSLDAAGNIYVYDDNTRSIKVYSPSAITGAPVRSLPVGPGTNIADVYDMMASQTGQIYVYDGRGIAVFAATANGNDPPVRYLSLPAGDGIELETFSVDQSGTLYVSNTMGLISVYAANANGSATPVRVIQGASTYLTGAAVTSLATDRSENLYVLCICQNGSRSPFGVYEFSSTADGNSAPIASFTANDMYPYFFNDAVAVDSDGTVYVDAGTAADRCAVFQFAPSASGATNYSSAVAIYGCTDAPLSRFAVN